MLTARFNEAVSWALELHREQVRKGRPVPYAAHLLAVTSLVLEAGGDEDEAIAAVLHDAVEDQGGPPTREQIRVRFGERVVSIVDGCTDTDQTPKPPWRERKQAFIDSIAEASESVRLVVSADKLHNTLSTIEDVRREGLVAFDKLRGPERALWYLRTLSGALEAAGGGPLSDRLERAVAELEALAAQAEPDPCDAA